MKFFLLDKQQNIIGRLSEEYILEATFTEEINTAGELLITLPAKKRLSGNVIHILINNPSKDRSYLMFKIIKETVKDEEVEYTAVESAYDELTSYGYIQDKRPTANARNITEMVLENTRWHVGQVPETNAIFISFYYLSVLDCLKKIVQTFNLEITFDVLINDAENQITDHRINFYIKQGEQTGKRFEYGSNLLSVKQEQDTQNIYTALVGRGKGAQVSDGDDNTPDGYGRRITFTDVEWSKAKGDPLDKPKGQEWIEDPDATKRLGFSDGHMRIGLQVFEDVDDPKMLLQKTYEALKTAERPQVQFSASVINTGELHLGDRVGITRNDIGIAYETRVFKVQHNLLDETQNKIDLGDNLEQTNSLSYQVSALQNEITNHQETLITVTQSADGKNKVFYSSTMPATGSNGDIWYKDLGNGETEMYLYDNGWQLIISTENLHKIENEVKQQQKALNQAIQDANAASAKADGLVAQVGDANTNAQKALTTAQQNQSDLSQAKLDLQNTKNTLSGVVSNVTQAQEDLKNTEQGLQGVEADLSNVKSQAVQQGKTIIDIQKKNDSLSSQIADAQGNITGLKQTAQGLQASVQDNKNNIANIKQTAGSIQSTVASMQNAGENLIVNSNFEQGAYHWNLNGWQISNDSEFRNHKIISKIQSGLSSANYNEFSATDLIPVQKGQTISIGVWVKANNIDSSGDGNWGATFGVNWYADNHSGRNHWTDFNDRTYYGNHDWQFLKMEGLQPPSDSHFVRAHFFLTQNGSAQFALPIMVYGDKLPAWGPSPLDSATATDMSTVEQTVNGLKSIVQNNKGDISTLKQTASGLESDVKNNHDSISVIKQTADKVQSTVSNMKVGGTNLLPETQNYTGYMRWGNVEVLDDYSYNDYVFKPQTKVLHLWTSNNNPIDNAYPTPDNKPVHIIQGKQYTFSAYVWHYGNTAQADELVTLYANNGDSTLELGTVTTMLTNQAVLYHFTFTAQQTGDYTRFRIVHRNGTAMSGGSMFIAEMKLEEGNVATDWSPSPYDLASETELTTVEETISGIKTTVQKKADISQLNQTANSLTAQIGNAKDDISSLKQRAGSIETNISNNKKDISSLKQTANSLQSNLQSKASVSQITQLSNAFQTTVQTIGPVLLNGTFDDKNVAAYYIPWDITKNMNNISINSNAHWLDLFGINNDDVKYMYKYYMPVIPGTVLTYSGSSKLNWGGGNPEPSARFYIHFYNTNKDEIQAFGEFYYKYDKNNQWQGFSASVTVPNGAAYVRIESRLTLNGCHQKTWLSLDDLKVSSGGDTISSKISQLSNDINLRVQKGDLISQINIEAGKTLIQSKNLYLDSDTVTFSGRAFIPSAAIADLSADKITTGTLNAGNVRIINLDANNITTGTISGPNLSINLNTGEILFQRGSIRSTNGNLNVDIDNGTFAETDYQGNGLYFRNGNLYLTSSGIWDTKSSVYGAIVKDDNLIDSATKGMEIVGGQGGIILHTQKYDPNDNWGEGVWGGAGTSGAGIAISDKNNGKILGHAYGKISFATNTGFNNGGYFKQYPNIQIGVTQDSNPQGDRIKIDAHYIHLYGGLPPTTSDSANVCMASDGAILKVTSASKYKKDIERTYETDYGKKLIELPTATWIDKAETKRSKNPRRYFGMIAEDLADAGLEMLVRRDANGEVDGIQYERLACALIPVVRELKEKINRLEEKVYGK